MEDAILALAHMCWGKPCGDGAVSSKEQEMIDKFEQLKRDEIQFEKDAKPYARSYIERYGMFMKKSAAANHARRDLIPVAQKVAEEAYLERGGKLVELVDPPDEEKWASADKEEDAAPRIMEGGSSDAAKTRDAYVVKDAQTTKKNAATRAKGKMDAWAKKIDTELTTQHTTEPRVFHRAAALSPTLLHQLSVGTSYVDPAPASSDTSAGTAMFYGGVRERDNAGTFSVHLKLRAPTGTRLANVGYGEHVIAPNTRYTVVGHQVKDGKHTVTMELSRDA